MEQEILRAHKRATRTMPLSACAVLLENLQNQGLTSSGLMGSGCGPYDSFHSIDHSTGLTRLVKGRCVLPKWLG